MCAGPVDGTCRRTPAGQPDHLEPPSRISTTTARDGIPSYPVVSSAARAEELYGRCASTNQPFGVLCRRSAASRRLASSSARRPISSIDASMLMRPAGVRCRGRAGTSVLLPTSLVVGRAPFLAPRTDIRPLPTPGLSSTSPLAQCQV
jgi:hypothetical protein